MTNQATEVIVDEARDSDGPGRIRKGATGLVASLILFAQSIPPLAIWGGLMTVPLLGYLALLFTSGPDHFLEALYGVFFGGFILDQVLSAIGLSLLIYSVVFMRVRRTDGLITTGPYRLVRHPQYLGATLFTLTLTSRSYWLLTNTRGVGWLGPQGTVVLWIATLITYVALASIEELHLTKEFGAEYETYRKSAGFLLPAIKTKRRSMEVLLSILIPALVLIVVIFVNAATPM
jgi:protein-S-isoprenylcysteine O-methyltransferase Ste14